MVKNSRIPGFFKLRQEEKIRLLKSLTKLTDKEIKILRKGSLSLSVREKMAENVVGTFSLPYSVVTNIRINKKDYLVPMVIEEPSVVAAACYGAKLTRAGVGIRAESLGSLTIGQIYITDIKDSKKAKERILKFKNKILKIANKQNPILIRAGGGAKDLKIKILKEKDIGLILRVHLFIDTKDAMGANTVASMAEAVSPLIEKITGKKSILKIVSNLADERLVRVRAKVEKKVLKKEGFPPSETIKRIVKAYKIAKIDIYRAVTNNKGILNGMGAVALATGNDWRALEAAAHGFAAKSGSYKPLSVWSEDKKGNLVGEMVVPVIVGIVGGIINIHPTAKISLKILDVKSSQELAQVIASVGLIQNLGALRALVSEGILAGHQSLKK